MTDRVHPQTTRRRTKDPTDRMAAKTFVLDTNVILHDSSCIFQFDEHDVVLPITVLEELDKFKNVNNFLNQLARLFIRRLDRLSEHSDLRQWLPLN